MSSSSPPFTQVLRSEIRRLNMAPREIAAILEVSTTTVEKWANGSAVPPAITQEGALARLAKAMPLLVATPSGHR